MGVHASFFSNQGIYMALPFIQKALHINLSNQDHFVEDIGVRSGIIGPVDFGWDEYRKHSEVFTFGIGKLATSPIQGSRRLVFCSYSDQWEGFYISSLGGAGHIFQHVGVNYIALTGKADQPSVLVLNNKGNGPEQRIEPMPQYADIWNGYADQNGKKLIGIYALQRAVLDKYAGEYDIRRHRVVCVGPAADKTIEGVIGSNTLKKGELTGVVDWAGRGGLGSRLLKKHNIVAIIFGGDWRDPDAAKTRDINPYFLDHYGDKAVKVDMSLTKKYHYDPKLETGGTFGSNYATLGDKIMTFNYRSLLHSKKERKQQHRDFIIDHYLKEFNEATIKPKNFDHCGEPCNVACKKLSDNEYKKDYEPYHTLGPQCGVFDIAAAELLNDHADAMGFDAIQIGGTIAWIMECVATGVMDPAEYGFPPASELTFAQFTANRQEFDLIKDSMKNSRYAIAIIDAILNDERASLFHNGIRSAAESLHHTGAMDLAVYLGHGKSGCMVPNQYWVPGMGSPMPIMGKYYVYYGAEFLTPDDLGRKNVERMVHELINDNCGVCRFHRGWSEGLMPIIMNDRFGLDIDFQKHHFELASQINDHQGGGSQPWSTKRMAKMLESYLDNIGSPHSTEEEPIDMYFDHESPLGSAHAFWRAIREGQQRAFRAGPDAITTVLTPKQNRERFGD